jgi:predicted Zn-dependent protease
MQAFRVSAPDARPAAAHAAATRAHTEVLAGFLLDMALLGVQSRYYASARTIVEVLLELVPRSRTVRLLRAHLLFRVSQAFEGRHELLELIEEFPDDHLATAMLAMEDREAGLDGWRGLAESLSADAVDPTSKEILRFVLRP